MSVLLTKDIWIFATGWAEEFGFKNTFNFHEHTYFFAELGFALPPLLCWDFGL